MEFYLQRDEDESGVSGTGRVAHGVVFDDGRIAMRWLTERGSTAAYDHLEDVRRIHGHGGKTRLVSGAGCALAACSLDMYGAVVMGLSRESDGMYKGLYMHLDKRGEVKSFWLERHGDEEQLRGWIISALASLVFDMGMSRLPDDQVWGDMLT